MTPFDRSMDDATALVRQGRLQEATALIQSRLGAGTPPPEAPPMRDVTPPEGGFAAKPSARPAPGFAETPGRRGGFAAKPPPEPGRFEERMHRGPHGSMAYKLFVPEGAGPGAPLLVMLHGCTQDPDDFARGTRMNEAAAERGVVVAYPRQEASRNPNRCWSWFEPSQTGEAGEAAVIAAIAREVVAAEGCDGGRVFAAGLSAGGAMAAALGVAHPDVFRAVGVHSGLAAGSARDMGSAFAAMAGRGGEARPLAVPAIVFHGRADRTVAPVNAERIAEAGRAGRAKPKVLRAEAGGRSYERARLPAEGRAGAVELWRVDGLGHAWSGGSARGSHADAQGPDASREMLRFFLDGPSR